MTKKMIALMGEQPIPNLLPIRYEKPAAALLVNTDRTRGVGDRLKRILEPAVTVHFCEVEPYDISSIYGEVVGKIEQLEWAAADLVFNLTGGTKTMAFAAYQLALEKTGSCFLYLESERGNSRLRQYKFQERLPTLERDEIIPDVISIEDYLAAYLDAFITQPIKEPFEQLLFDTLAGEVDEIVAAVQTPTGTLDIDLVVRIGNQVGIIEAKTGGKARRKGGIDQLNTAGGRSFLGIYTKKFLVVDRSWQDLSNLSELAAARFITVIELPSYGQSKQLSAEDRDRLITTIKKGLGAG